MKQKAKKKNDALFVKKKTTFKTLGINLYGLLERVFFLIPFLNRLIAKYRLYYPGDSKECASAAASCLIKIYLVFAVVFPVIFGTNPSVYTFLISIFLMYVFASEIIHSSHTKLEIRFLKSFDNFLSLSRHYYYKYGSIRDALMSSETEANPIITGHIKEMLKCLASPDSASAVNEYINSGYHKYLRLYISLARLVDENGDVWDENGSVFLSSCMKMKYDIEEDIRFISERKHKFSGFVLTATLPVISVPYIAMWGVSTIPSLNLFYYGYIGAAAKLFLLMISLLGFVSIRRLKYGEAVEKRKHSVLEKMLKIRFFDRLSGILMNLSKKKTRKTEVLLSRLNERYGIKAFFLKKVLYFLVTFVISLCTLYYGHREAKNIYRYDISDIEDALPVTDLRQLEALKTLIPAYIDTIIGKGEYPDIKKVSEALLEEKDVKSSTLAEEAAVLILKRVDLYRAELFGPKDVLLSLIFALIAYGWPGIALLYRKSLVETRIQDEVMQFRSIIHMLKNIPGISVFSLLEEMELFADIFKPSVRQCINEYNISDEKALMRLYDTEKDAGFRRIVDCFLMADELGMDDAFEEISAEIENFRENRKLERKVTLDSEGMLGAVLSVLPGGIILFGYLLCPFMVRSMQIFNDYQASISMMAR